MSTTAPTVSQTIEPGAYYTARDRKTGSLVLCAAATEDRVLGVTLTGGADGKSPATFCCSAPEFPKHWEVVSRFDEALSDLERWVEFYKSETLRCSSERDAARMALESEKVSTGNLEKQLESWKHETSEVSRQKAVMFLDLKTATRQVVRLEKLVEEGQKLLRSSLEVAADELEAARAVAEASANEITYWKAETQRWADRLREVENRTAHAVDALRGELAPPTIDEIRELRGLEPLAPWVTEPAPYVPHMRDTSDLTTRPEWASTDTFRGDLEEEVTP